MFNESKYTKWYFNIIKRATASDCFPSGYTERHHIIPKSLGGDNSEDNLVYLTAKEHYICHHLLTKMVSGKARRSMAYAFYCMLVMENKHQLRYKVSSRVYENLKRDNTDLHKTYGMQGKKLSESSKKKISEAMKGRVPWNKGTIGISKGPTGMKHTKETKDKIRTARKKQAINHTDETRERMSLAAKKVWTKRREAITNV